MFATVVTVITIVYYLLVLGVAIAVIVDNKNPAKTLAYLLVLLFVPVLGLVVYVLFGQNLRKQKLFSRKGIKDNVWLKSWTEERENVFNETAKVDDGFLAGKAKIARLLQNNDDAALTRNNNLEILYNTSLIFERMFTDMRTAKHHLHVEFYILENDEIGNEFKNILIDRAKNGVEVRLSIDDVGSRKLPAKFINQLKDAGVVVGKFMPVIFPFLTSRANYRNHRKIVVVDGRVGYIGGLNIADRYTNRIKKFAFWRDTQLRMEGECVKSLQIQFLLNWRFVTKESVEIGKKYFPDLPEINTQYAQIVGAGPDSDWPNIMQGLLMAISTAKKYVYITTPYFIPTEEVLNALQVAALGGIDVKIILPRSGDSWLTQAASMSYIKQMLAAGVRVFWYKKGFVHAKTMVVDDGFATVGTTNMDIRSFNINFEINCFMYNNELAKSLRNQFEEDLHESEEINLSRWDKRPRTKKLIESLARMFAPLL